MKAEKLKKILKEHIEWLNNNNKGCRADLRGAYLSGADLRGADLRGANLSGAYLSDANLSGAYLSGADLSDANLSDADLSGADLSGADLSDANLSDADLRDANLRDADLSDAKYDVGTAFFALQCPEDGAFVAWKKARGGYIVKLEIPGDAQRSSATTRKCRSDKAKVLGIYDCNKQLTDRQEAISSYDKNFIYKVGEVVHVNNFYNDRWCECSAGIHFFITFEEAKNYIL